MASAFSHAVVAVAMGRAMRTQVLSGREILLGALCSVVPDLDVIGFHTGVPYGDLWGHRGLTHSLIFALVLSGMLVRWGYCRRSKGERWRLFLYFFFCTLSHGVLDAMTNGGLGIAFFSPFDTTRYFFPLRPVLVSPIGIGEFFGAYGVQVLMSEMLWIWTPILLGLLLLRFVRCFQHT